jgi:hypothetical protein
VNIISYFAHFLLHILNKMFVCALYHLHNSTPKTTPFSRLGKENIWFQLFRTNRGNYIGVAWISRFMKQSFVNNV